MPKLKVEKVQSNEVVKIKKAIQTISRGFAWDSEGEMIVHLVNSSGKTLCGQSTRCGAEKGWYTASSDDVVNCPICSKSV